MAGRLAPCGTVPRGVCVPSVAPTANRRSGSSVRSSTDSSPWMPCGLPMRPTTTSCVLIGPRVRGHVQQAPSPSTRTLNGARRPLLGSAPAVHVDEVDASTALAGQCTDHGAQGGGGASTSSDDLAKVVRVHPHLEDGSATKLFVLDHHVVGVPDDTPNQVLERFGEHGAQAPVSSRSLSRLVCSASTVLTSIASASSVAPSGVSAPGVSFWAGASAAFLVAARLLVTASTCGSLPAALSASLKISALSRLGSLTFRVPSAPGRPLNLCQSPVTLSSASTASDGCAPTPSQYCARSEVTSISEGSSLGWYLPICSITLPSRFLRESTTTTR